MRVRHLIFVLAICIFFLFTYHGGAAEEEGKECPKPYINTIVPWAAKPGNLVKIQGKRFGLERGEVIFTEEAYFPLQQLSNPPRVKAEIISWTLHRIWVIVPKSAVSGPVFVKIPCGSESNKKDFKVNK